MRDLFSVIDGIWGNRAKNSRQQIMPPDPF
jgi:hypothetical protein